MKAAKTIPAPRDCAGLVDLPHGFGMAPLFLRETDKNTWRWTFEIRRPTGASATLRVTVTPSDSGGTWAVICVCQELRNVDAAQFVEILTAARLATAIRRTTGEVLVKLGKAWCRA